MDDRAVTEIVGFILVVSIILGTISIVYVGGFAGLQDTRDNEQSTNAERAFDVLAHSFEDIARNSAPSGATEIKLADSQISVRDNMRVSTNASSMATAASARPRPIVYDTGGSDTQIVYENGAVIREDGDSALMIREPDFVFDSDRTVLRYIEIRGGAASVAGTTTVLVNGERTQTRLLAAESNPGTVNVSYRTTTMRVGVWEQYFNRALDGMGSDCTVTEDEENIATVDCEFETQSLHVARTRISVSLD